MEDYLKEFKRYKEKMKIMREDIYKQLESVNDEELRSFYEYNHLVKENDYTDKIWLDIEDKSIQAGIEALDKLIVNETEISKIDAKKYELYKLIFSNYKKQNEITDDTLLKISKDFNKEKNYDLIKSLNKGEWYRISREEPYICDAIFEKLSTENTLTKDSLKSLATQLNLIRNNNLNNKKVNVGKWYLVNEKEQELCEEIQEFAREKNYNFNNIDLEKIAKAKNLDVNQNILVETDEIALELENQDEDLAKFLKNNDYKITKTLIKKMVNERVNLNYKELFVTTENKNWYIVDKMQRKLCSELYEVLNKSNFNGYESKIEVLAKEKNEKKNNSLNKKLTIGDWYIVDKRRKALCNDINKIVSENTYRIDSNKQEELKEIASKTNKFKNSKILLPLNTGEWYKLEGKKTELCEEVHNIVRPLNYEVDESLIAKIVREKTELEDKYLLEKAFADNWYVVDGQEACICGEIKNICENNNYKVKEEEISNLASKINEEKNSALKNVIIEGNWYLIEGAKEEICKDVFEIYKKENFMMHFEKFESFAKEKNREKNSEYIFKRENSWWNIEAENEVIYSEVYKILRRVGFEIVKGNIDFENLAKKINQSRNEELLKEDNGWFGLKKIIKYSETKNNKLLYERKGTEILNEIIHVAKLICRRDMELEMKENNSIALFKKKEKELVELYIDIANKMRDKYRNGMLKDNKNRKVYKEAYEKYKTDFLEIANKICLVYYRNQLISVLKQKQYDNLYKKTYETYKDIAKTICALYKSNKIQEERNKFIYNLYEEEIYKELLVLANEICSKYKELEAKENLNKQRFIINEKLIKADLLELSEKICEKYFEDVRREGERQNKIKELYSKTEEELTQMSKVIIDKYKSAKKLETQNIKKFESEYNRYYKKIATLAKKICDLYQSNKLIEEKAKVEFKEKEVQIQSELGIIARKIENTYRKNKLKEEENLKVFEAKGKSIYEDAQKLYENILNTRKLLGKLSDYFSNEVKDECIDKFYEEKDIRLNLEKMMLALNIFRENREVFNDISDMSQEKILALEMSI